MKNTFSISSFTVSVSKVDTLAYRVIIVNENYPTLVITGDIYQSVGYPGTFHLFDIKIDSSGYLLSDLAKVFESLDCYLDEIGAEIIKMYK